MQQRQSDDGPKILLPEHASVDNIGIVSMQEKVWYNTNKFDVEIAGVSCAVRLMFFMYLIERGARDIQDAWVDSRHQCESQQTKQMFSVATVHRCV
jgi:hypothetical protein